MGTSFPNFPYMNQAKKNDPGGLEKRMKEKTEQTA